MKSLKNILSIAICGALLVPASLHSADIRFFGNFDGRTPIKSNAAVRNSALKLGHTGGIVRRFNFSSWAPKIGSLKNLNWRHGLIGAGLAATAALAGCGSGGHGGGVSTNTIVDLCANELSLRNSTNLEIFEVYIDGRYETSFGPGMEVSFCFLPGFYNVDVYESYSGSLVYTQDLSLTGTGQDTAVDLVDPDESELIVENFTHGKLQLRVDGILYDNIPSGLVAHFPVNAGTRQISIVDYEDLNVLYFGNDLFSAGSAYTYTIEACVEMLFHNATGVPISVSIDGMVYTQQPYPSSYSYFVDSGNHNVTVREFGSSGSLIYSDSGYFNCGTYNISL